MSITSQISVAAPAKLNLYLRVVGRRDDGYHLLDSLVGFADIHDTLVVSGDDRLSLTLDGPFAPALSRDPDNLVLRAARLLAEAAGTVPEARLRLFKRLPVAAGIGGGSADAAAALRALDRLWDLRMGADDMAALALQLGADVPVCLNGTAVRMAGIGETLSPIGRLPAAGLVLVNPGVALSTAEVFGARRGRFSAPAEFEAGALANVAPGELAALLAPLGNDLTAGAEALAPVVARVLDRVAADDACLLARMSGSGATCFGLYLDTATAVSVATALAAEHPAWWVAAGRLLDDTTDLEPTP